MSSTFAWLDHDEAARQRMREIVGLFQDSGSVDELGLGRIRDAFSDRFFPGTSVLWRRARYLLFVAWTYERLERDGYRQQNAEAAARALQRNLRNVLIATGDTEGVIGLRQADPVSPPDVILWAALEQWGIRALGVGTLSQYRSTLTRKPRPAHDEDGQGPIGDTSVWHPRLPAAPESFPDGSSFALTHREAVFLRDLVLDDDADASSTAAKRADSLLAALLRTDELLPTERPWEHPLDEHASDELRLALHLAGCFSDVMHGASLAYAHRLNALRNETDRVEGIESDLAEWADRLSTERSAVLTEWAHDLDRFFAVVRNLNRRISASDQRFVEDWTALALADPAGVATSRAAVELLEDREARTKGGKARLAAPRDKDRGDGGASPAAMTYRWGNAFRIAADIRAGLEV